MKSKPAPRFCILSPVSRGICLVQMVCSSGSCFARTRHEPFTMQRPLLQPKCHNAPALLADLAQRIVAKYGSGLPRHDLQALLDDRDLLSIRCEVRFDAVPLLPGECAHLAPGGFGPEDGFLLYLHPTFAFQLNAVPVLALPHVGRLATYGKASPEEAERFGAAVMGVSPEDYYETLCGLAGQLGGDDLC
jgi:hypothetical protein